MVGAARLGHFGMAECDELVDVELVIGEEHELLEVLGSRAGVVPQARQRIVDARRREQREGIWLHVDAAYAGVAAMLPTHRHILAGVEAADSLVVNPHKWLFTPFDLSAFYSRHMDLVRAAFSLTPEYLKTAEGDAGTVHNLMDTGVQLGRRFRALKLWMVMRSFGAGGLCDELSRHIDLAQQLAAWVDAHPDFTRVAPAPFSVVCFRWEPAAWRMTPPPFDADALDAMNARVIDRVNASGEIFLSHTRLYGRYVIRVAIGHERTSIVHVQRAWELLLQQARTIQDSADPAQP